MENFETFISSVRDLSSKGLGVATHPDGRIFFATGVWPGDVAEFAVEKSKKRYGYAKLVKLITPSPERAAAPLPCSYQGHENGRCGGCPWMIANYKSQLYFKQQRIEYAIRRLQIPLQKEAIQQIWPAPATLGYRNRTQLKTDGEKLGLVSTESNTLVPITDCPVLSSHNRELLALILKSLPNLKWTPPPNRRWNFLEIDDQIPLAAVAGDALAVLKLNQRRPFRQGNSEQNLKMREWVTQKLKLLTVECALELFCGSGNFTEILIATGIRQILAVDSQSEAIEKLRERKWPQVKIEEMNLFSAPVWRQLSHLWPDERHRAELLLLNPPREGLEVRKGMEEAFPALKHIIYISCNPDTFARDLSDLSKQGGWKLRELRPLDQFPHTAHVELLAYLRR